MSEQDKAAIAQQAVPDDIKDTIGKLLAEAMNTAVSNGANSVSMPDEYVALAVWLAAAPVAPQASQGEAVTMQLAAFRASQVEAGIPDEDLMPEAPAQAIAYLIANAKEWR